MEMVATIQAEYQLQEEEICFVGDELVDLPVLRRVGFAVAVPNAVAEVKAVAHYITRHTGGNGAVREVIEMILQATGRWEKALAKYLVLLLTGLCLTSFAQAERPAASGYIEKFEVPQRDANGNLQWKLAGDRATFRADGLMDIRNARAEFYASNKVSFVFTTPLCVLDRANHRAATAAPVRLERENMTLTGIGGEWSGSNTTILIRHNVQMIITGSSLFAPAANQP